MWVKIHSGSKGCTKGAFLPTPLLCTLLCLLWQVLSAYSFPNEQHPYWNKQNISSTWLAPTSQQNHVLPTGSLALGRVFFSLQGERSGMEEPFEQLGKHRNLKTFFFIFKGNFSLPCSGWGRHLATVPQQASKKKPWHLPNPKPRCRKHFCALCVLLGCFPLPCTPIHSCPMAEASLERCPICTTLRPSAWPPCHHTPVLFLPSEQHMATGDKRLF